jgi:type IV pilus biogenesis protein CpaD/CtpE
MKRLSMAIALLALPACTPNDTTLGGALRHDMALQTIAPAPRHDEQRVEGSDGQRSAKAIERYQKGEVKQPVTLQTTKSTGSGAGGGATPNN